MSNNRETRLVQDKIHLFLAIKRVGTAKDKRCIRTVIKDEEFDLKILEAKLKVIGGEWRIHHTVNARNPEMARKHLIKFLIDHPERASCIDTEWRTALLQRQCKAERLFMLDIDTQDKEKVKVVNDLIIDSFTKNLKVIHKGKELECGNKDYSPNPFVIGKYKSPKGWHYITEPFDTREICKLDYVTLLRDGYYYVKTVEEI